MKYILWTGKKADLITRILENDDGDGSANSADGEAADNVDAAAEEDDIIAAVDDVTDDVADPTEAVDDSAEASASDTTAAKPAGLTDDEVTPRLLLLSQGLFVDQTCFSTVNSLQIRICSLHTHMHTHTRALHICSLNRLDVGCC